MVAVKIFAELGDAARALQAERGACFLGGGTLLMRRVNEGDVAIKTIIRTDDPGFRRIDSQGERIRLGAGVTMGQVLANQDLAALHPAARGIGGPAIRAMATVGGNLFAPSPYGDFTAAVLALDGRVHPAGSYAPRDVPLEDFLRNRQGHGLIGAISVLRPRNLDEFRFLKVSRVKPKGIAVLSIAAWLPGASHRISGARIAYNAMAPVPIRMTAIERALEGRALDQDGIKAAIGQAVEGTAPTTDAIASAWYRREVCPVQLRRLLLKETGE